MGFSLMSSLFGSAMLQPWRGKEFWATAMPAVELVLEKIA